MTATLHKGTSRRKPPRPPTAHELAYDRAILALLAARDAINEALALPPEDWHLAGAVEELAAWRYLLGQTTDAMTSQSRLVLPDLHQRVMRDTCSSLGLPATFIRPRERSAS